MYPTPRATQQEERVVALASWLVTFVAPLLGPAIIYFLYLSRSKFVAYHAMQALLFHVLIAVAATLLAVITAVTCGVGAILAIPGAIVLGLVGVIVPVLYAIQAYSGGAPSFPFVGKWARDIVGRF